MKNYVNIKTCHSETFQARRNMNLLTGICIICLSLFSLPTLQAQDIENSTDTAQVSTTNLQKNILVQGNVSDEFGPLPDVNVHLEGTRIGTATDENGDFEFPQKLKQGDILVFSHIGLKSQKIKITDAHSAAKIELKVDMLMDDIIIVGKVASKNVYKSTSN